MVIRFRELVVNLRDICRIRLDSYDLVVFVDWLFILPFLERRHSHSDRVSSVTESIFRFIHFKFLYFSLSVHEYFKFQQLLRSVREFFPLSFIDFFPPSQTYLRIPRMPGSNLDLAACFHFFVHPSLFCDLWLLLALCIGTRNVAQGRFFFSRRPSRLWLLLHL